ncbi:hypothetical protein [Flavobacterium sp.]|uniref:hypothetical protein n=1 Tax=Flavobacterium sp. TaxID=239 RepID=UPI0038FBEAC3
MILKKYQPIIEVLMLSIVVYIGNKMFFYYNETNPKYQGLYYSLETLYSFFSICSTIIVFILIQIRNNNIDNVGFAYLWLTLIKMGVSYVLLHPILQSQNPNIRFEKLHFFLIFAVFLTIETIVTVKILNNKQ